MNRSNTTSFAAQIHQHLVAQRPPRDMGMRSAAVALGVSVRTLRRHLTAEGRSYTELVQEAFATIAKTCLLDERRTIVETALELGFADNTGFHRAFKRWTGLTPTEYRRQNTVNAEHAAVREDSERTSRSTV